MSEADPRHAESSASAASSSGPRVFISYTHDNPAHRANLLDLAQTMRSEGIDAWIDQYEEASPPLSWPVWMRRQIAEARFVLIVATAAYQRRFEGNEEPGVGRGATWEGSIITDELYHQLDERVKFIPIIVDETDAQYIPTPLRLTNRYVVGSPGHRNLEPLRRHLLSQPAVVPLPLRAPYEEGKNGRDALTAADERIGAALADAKAGRRVAAKRLLTEVINDADPAARGNAAFELGQLHDQDDEWSQALTAYQRALDLTREGAVAEVAARNLRVIVERLNAHYEGPVAAVYEWLQAVKGANADDTWAGLEPSLRLVLAQDWILANESHPELRPYPREQLAAALSARRPRHPLAADFQEIQLLKFRDAFSEWNPETWGAASNPRHIGLDYELVLLSPTGGDALIWQPGGKLFTWPFLLRRVLAEWLIVNFESAYPVPGWPPSHDPISVPGTTLISRDELPDEDS